MVLDHWLLFDFHPEIAAIAASAQGLGAPPDDLGVHITITDIVSLTEASAKFWTIVSFAFVVVGTLYHVEAEFPFWVVVPDGFETGRFSEHLWRQFLEEQGH